MPGYGSKDKLAREAMKVYGSWFSQPGLVPPEPPRMLPLPADLSINGLRDRINVMSRPLEKEGTETVNVIIRPKYTISYVEQFDVRVDQYMLYYGDYLRGKDENGNGPAEGYDEDGDEEPDYDGGEGGPGGANYPENQKIKVVENINVVGERDDTIICVPTLKYRDTQILSFSEDIDIPGLPNMVSGVDNMLINYKQ